MKLDVFKMFKENLQDLLLIRDIQ